MIPSDFGPSGQDRIGDGVAVVIPCYQVAGSITEVLEAIGPSVARIFCVDDASTDGTGSLIERAAVADERIVLLKRMQNGGVGAATIDGYQAALAAGARVVVKLDGDGQMDPGLIPLLCRPILESEADYVKGNRFYSRESLDQMPRMRIWGNAGLSFFSKASTGYWNLFDPNNGFTAIHADVAAALPFDRLHKRYFFESDIVFRLGILRARVVEIPMDSVYGDEESHLSLVDSALRFPLLHGSNFLKRVFYNYFLRNFSIATINLLVGILFLVGGALFGAWKWAESIRTGVPATAGSVMLSALPVLVGTQLILSFLAYDMALVPDRAVHRYLRRAAGRPNPVTKAD